MRQMRIRWIFCVGYAFSVGGYLAAQSNYLIQTVAGSSSVGDGGLALNASFAQVEGVSADRAGNIYISDAGDHRIRCVRPGGIVQTIAGTGTAAFAGDGGAATTAQINSPYGISADKWGNLYIADLGNHRIRKVSLNGTITTVAGGGAIPAGPAGDGGPATAVGLDAPRNVLADDLGGFYLSDFDAHRVYYVDSAGTIQTLAGTGKAGAGGTSASAVDSPLHSPAGLSFDLQGGILIADSGNHRIRRLWRGTISTYSLLPNRPVQLYSPTDVVLDLAGNLWIADDRPNGTLLRTANGDITVLPAGGRALTVDPRGVGYIASLGLIRSVSSDARGNRGVGFFAGNGGYGFGGDDGAADAARLNWPASIAADAFGNLYVADERNHRVRKITATGTISTYAGTGLPGYGGDGGKAMNAKLNLPRSVAVDRAGNLYIAEAGNHVVRRVSVDGLISTFAGDGFSGYRGDGGYASAARLKEPSAVAVSDTGEVYISDTGNSAVRKVSLSGLIVPVAAGLLRPWGLAFDTLGALYVAEEGGGRVKRLDILGNITLADSGCDTPRGIAMGRDGILYVSETGKHRLRRVKALFSFDIIAGSGEPGLSGDGGPATTARLAFPDGILLTANGDLLVADSGNHRIRKLTPASAAAVVAEPVRFEFSLVHAALNRPTPLAAGTLISLYAPFELHSEGRLLFDGVEANILARTANQWNAIVPNSAAGKTTMTVEIWDRTKSVARRLVEIVPAVPGLFSAPGEAQRAIAQREDGTWIMGGTTAARNSIVTIFATGLDAGNPVTVLLAGREIPLAEPASTTVGVTAIRFRVPGAYIGGGEQGLSIRNGKTESPELNLRIE